MNEQAFIKIKKDILEIIDSLKMPFKLEIEEQLKAQITLSKYLPDTKESIKALNLCLYKAKCYKKIELDFPDTLINSDEELSSKLELLRKNLAKHYTLFLGEFFSIKVNESEALLVYENIKIFLHKIINRFTLDREIKVKILNFLAVFFEKNERVFAICSFRKALKYFFDFIEYLIAEKSSLQVVAFIEKLTILENLEFFSNKAFTETNKSAYKIIYEIDALLLYKSLLWQIRLLTKSLFSDDLLLKEFIKAFIDQFTDLYPTKNDFDSIIPLLYFVLESKARKPIIETSSTWLNTLSSELKEKLIGETEIGLQLLKFRKSYEQKTSVKIEVTFKQFKKVDPTKVSLFLKVEEIAPEVICRFFLENINRSTISVKQAFFLTLKKMNYISLRPIEHYEKTIAEMKNPLEKGIEFYKNKFIEAAQGIATKSLELIKNFESHVPSEKVDLPLPSEVLKDEGIISVADIKENLNKINTDLQICKSSLKSLCFGINIHYFPVCANFGKEKAFKYPLDRNILIEVEKLEKEVDEFIKKNSRKEFTKQLITNILFLNKQISWFNSETKPGHLVKQLFRRGYFSKNKIKFAKLKNRLGVQIDLDAEINFFKNQNFFSLLSYGIIRWPWLNKTFFATNWAEQLVFLKATNQISEKKYDVKLEQCISNGNLDNESNFFSEVIELYNNITRTSVENKYALASIYSSLNSEIKSFESKLETLLGKLYTNTLPIQKINHALSPQTILHRANELFFDRNLKKERSILSIPTVNLAKN